MYVRCPAKGLVYHSQTQCSQNTPWPWLLKKNEWCFEGALHSLSLLKDNINLKKKKLILEGPKPAASFLALFSLYLPDSDPKSEVLYSWDYWNLLGFWIICILFSERKLPLSSRMNFALFRALWFFTKSRHLSFWEQSSRSWRLMHWEKGCFDYGGGLHCNPQIWRTTQNLNRRLVHPRGHCYCRIRSGIEYLYYSSWSMVIAGYTERNAFSKNVYIMMLHDISVNKGVKTNLSLFHSAKTSVIRGSLSLSVCWWLF